MEESNGRPGATDYAGEVELIPVPEGTTDPDAGLPAPLADALAAFRTDPDPDAREEPGSTPLPDGWELFRAVYGGATRDTLEKYHASEHRDTWVGLDYREALDHGRLSRGLHIFTGHTGGGKTGLACGLVLEAVKAGHPAVYVSLELDREEIAARLIALEGGLPWGRLSANRALHSNPEKRERLNREKHAAIDALEEPLGRLYVWAPDPKPEEPAPTAAELREFVRDVWERHGRKTPLVVFDYLQAPGIYARDQVEERRLSIRERISAVIYQLRHLSKVDPAGEWVGCPVVVLSTTARSNVRAGATGKQESRRADPLAGMDGNDPDLLRLASLEDLKALPKEAGEVEAAAVTSWALSLESTTGSGKRKLTLRLAKGRKLPNGQWLPLRFNGTTGRIEDDPERYGAARQEDADRAERAAKKRAIAEAETLPDPSPAPATDRGAELALLENARPGKRRQ